jgi:hypothetical protein
VRILDPCARRLAGILCSWLICLSAARAADFLERPAHFDIAAGPLAGALLQFSSQSGVQVALGDTDAAQVRVGAFSGDCSIRDALTHLLKDTGLTFSPVGTAMVAIRAAASAPPVARRDAAIPARPAPEPAPPTAPEPAELPEVAVIAPRPPTAEELAGDSLFQFIVHHATTHYSVAAGNVGGSLLRWRGGRSESICPRTVGLEPGYNAFVSARILAVAAFVGAPVESDRECKANVQVIFTTDPRQAMQTILDWGTQAPRARFPHQEEKELALSAGHAVQGWYVTAGGGSSVLNRDSGLIPGIELESLWPRVIAKSIQANGRNRSILAVYLVIDTREVAGATIGSIADYLAVAALTVAESPDHCDPLPSILDLMAPSCDTRAKPSGITAGDVAFLKALYYRNTGLGGTLSRDEMMSNMTQQFRGG